MYLKILSTEYIYAVPVHLQGVAKPLRPPGSTLRSDDLTKYFIPNESPSKTASRDVIRAIITYGYAQVFCIIRQNALAHEGFDHQD